MIAAYVRADKHTSAHVFLVLVFDIVKYKVVYRLYLI